MGKNHKRMPQLQPSASAPSLPWWRAQPKNAARARLAVGRGDVKLTFGTPKRNRVTCCVCGRRNGVILQGQGSGAGCSLGNAERWLDYTCRSVFKADPVPLGVIKKPGPTALDSAEDAPAASPNPLTPALSRAPVGTKLGSNPAPFVESRCYRRWEQLG